MECDPGTFERIANTKSFDVKPAVLVERDVRLVRYAFSEVQQRSADVRNAGKI